MSKLGNVRVRKNSGAIVGTRRLLNLIEGANITITVTDDGTGDEIDITIAAAGGAGTGVDDVLFPAPDPNAVKGTYPAVLMADEQSTTVRQVFNVPNNYSSLDTAVVVVIPDASGNMRRAVSTNFGALCSNEDFQTHTDSIAAGQIAVDIDEIECIDIIAALTGAVGGDLIGIEFTRDATNASDTVDADVYYIGIYIEGTT